MADVADFAELVADYTNARTLANGLDDADEAITDATDALTDPVADGGLNVSLIDGATNFTTKNDVYLFDAEDGNQSLNNFGQTGLDRIYFGEGYTLVPIAADEDMTDTQGDAAALEIFWDQQGTSLVLWVEEETFAGNGSTEADTVKITLTGVDAVADGVALGSNGFFSAGTAV